MHSISSKITQANEKERKETKKKARRKKGAEEKRKKQWLVTLIVNLHIGYYNRFHWSQDAKAYKSLNKRSQHFKKLTKEKGKVSAQKGEVNL